jgi:hypothetical protein
MCNFWSRREQEVGPNGVHIDAPDGGDMLSLEQEGAAGRSRVEECSQMYQRVYMYHFRSWRSGNSGGVPMNAPESVYV